MLHLTGNTGDAIRVTFMRTHSDMRAQELICGRRVMLKEDDKTVLPGDTCFAIICGISDDNTTCYVKALQVVKKGDGERSWIQKLLAAPTAKQLEECGSFTGVVIDRFNKQYIGLFSYVEDLLDLIEFDTIIKHRLPVDVELGSQFPNDLDLDELTRHLEAIAEICGQVSTVSSDVSVWLRLAVYANCRARGSSLFERLLKKALEAEVSNLVLQVHYNILCHVPDGQSKRWANKLRKKLPAVDDTADPAQDESELQIARAIACVMDNDFAAARTLLLQVDESAGHRHVLWLVAVSIALGQFEEALDYLDLALLLER